MLRTYVLFVCITGYFLLLYLSRPPLGKIPDYVPASNHSVRDGEIKEYRCFSFNFINSRETNLIIVKKISLASKESDVC